MNRLLTIPEISLMTGIDSERLEDDLKSKELNSLFAKDVISYLKKNRILIKNLELLKEDCLLQKGKEYEER